MIVERARPRSDSCRRKLVTAIVKTVTAGLVCCALLCFGKPTSAQSSDELTATVLDSAQFAEQLLSIADICDRYELPAQAELTRRWQSPNLDGETTLYLPKPLWDETQASKLATSWARRFNAARRQHAAHLLQAADQWIAQDETAAYRMVWHALREDPGNERARQILGTLAKAADVRPKLTRGRTAHPSFGWPAGTYSRIQTPHFLLTTRGDARASRRLAEQLEQFYALWSQTFFAWWCPPEVLKNRLQGASAPWPKHRNLEVVLLKDREDYIQTLGGNEGHIGVSVGYYSPDAKQSFFYPSAELDQTLYHELTHQLLMEATRIGAQADAGTDRELWLLEGIALYMESLAERDGYWTLGGIDAPRLQTARYRGVRDGYWPEWSTFHSGNLESWKRDPEISRLYAHAVGLSHVFLDRLGNAARDAYLKELASVYQNQASDDRLLTFLAQDEARATERYQELLIVQESQFKDLLQAARQPEELVLCGSEFSAATWRSLEQMNGLRWLDVSFSNVAPGDLSWLSEASSLRRLSLEGTSASNEVMARIQPLAALEELDLSGCPIDDAGLQRLAGHPSLETLWLTDTQVTNDALDILKTLPRLKQCDVSGSRIESAAWQAFLQQHPRVNRGR